MTVEPTIPAEAPSPGATAAPPRPATQSARPAAILEVAARIVATEGPHAATVRRIAADIGVSSAALYGHFPDKDAILRGVCTQATERLRRALCDPAPDPAPPIERLQRLLRGAVDWALDHPHVYRLLFTADLCAPGCHALGRRLLGVARRAIRAIGAAAGSDPAFARATRPAALRALRATAHGLVLSLTADARPPFPRPPLAAIDFTLERLLAGLTATGDPTPAAGDVGHDLVTSIMQVKSEG